MIDAKDSSQTAAPRNRFLGTVAKYAQRTWLQCMVLALVSFGARFPSLQGQRIWDDQYLALENPFIKSPLLIVEAFRHYLFLESFSSHYRPVQNVSYMFDYFVWNTDAYGFHLTNVLLHAGCAVLLYLLLRNLIGSLWFRDASMRTHGRLLLRVPVISVMALLMALLWAVHPVHSAAVDYISGRADSLAFLFAAAAWLLTFRARTEQRPRRRYAFFVLAGVSALVALLSREIAAIWFALFLIHFLLVERNVSHRARIAAVTACVLLFGIYAGFRQLPVQRSLPSASAWPAPMRVALMARSLGDYTRLLTFPGNLHMERNLLEPASYGSNADWRGAVAAEYLSVLGVLAAGAVAFACWKRGAGRNMRIFGAGWFVVGYLPISNLIPLNATVAEHWLYLPSVGFLIFLAGCAVELPIRYRRTVTAFACLATIGLAARSVVRSTDWANEETFYTRTIEAGGCSTRAATNLAEIYSARGDAVGAERIFRRVLALTPDYPMARNNLANLLQKQGRTPEAEAMFGSSAKAALESRKDYPGTWVAALNLAHLRYGEGNVEGALQIVDKARREYPETWEVIRFQAELLRVSKRFDDAVKVVGEFAHENWWHYGASLALGRLYAEQGDAERAEAAWRHASWLDVHDAESLNLIAAVRVRQNLLEAAVQTQRRAVARQPYQPRQYRMLSDILTQMGRTDEARATLAQVAQLEASVKPETRVN